MAKKYSDIDLSKYNSGYTKSYDVIDAEEKKTAADKAVSSYGDFSYSNQDWLNEIMGNIKNRKEFSYDLNGDALYQQYKDKYIQQGKMAMQDTMGQAAAMTGGYGNSYAASVGNQAYQAQLNNLNDIVPELYQMAYDKYLQEGQDLYNQYGMLSDDRNTEYGMWSDEYNRLLEDRNYYSTEANNAYTKDYGQWSDNRTYDQNQYWNETEMGYAMDEANKGYARQDAYAMIQAGIMPSDDVLAAAGISKEDAQKIADAYKSSYSSGGGSGSGSGGSGGGGGNVKTDTTGVNSKIQEKAQSFNTNTALSNYLNGLVADGSITEDQAVELFGEYKNSEDDLKERKWTQVDNGGVNWFWGVDNNAVVQDQYGNKYRLDDLVDALVKEGMSKKEAKAFVKKYN